MFKNQTEYRESVVVVFCGPAGSGKSSICRRLTQMDPSLCLSVSTTTRLPRPGEVEGEDYFFIDEAEFKKRIDEGRFVEHASFSGHRYGTETLNIERAVLTGKDLLLDIEVEGVKQLKALYGRHLITVFVFPPSFSVLVERLRGRGSESEEELNRRLKTARREIEVLSSPSFADYLLINDNFEHAIEQARGVIYAERMRFSRYRQSFIDEVLDYKVLDRA